VQNVSLCGVATALRQSTGRLFFFLTRWLAYDPRHIQMQIRDIDAPKLLSLSALVKFNDGLHYYDKFEINFTKIICFVNNEVVFP
jgi:hypothetical protein